MKTMSDRDFAAAHDRYLEPPDENDERQDGAENEDFAYEQERQRQLDETEGMK